MLKFPLCYSPITILKNSYYGFRSNVHSPNTLQMYTTKKAKKKKIEIRIICFIEKCPLASIDIDASSNTPKIAQNKNWTGKRSEN